MIDKLGIEIQFNKEATTEEVLKYNPVQVLYATGGSPIQPKSIVGIDKTHVTTAIDVLQNKALLGENIVVIGAGLVGCETVVVLAMGYSPNTALYQDLKDQVEITNVGDSIKARKVLDAVKEAHDAVLYGARHLTY